MPGRTSDLKICSFLPSGTEMVCLLGLEGNLVAVTHECDHPPSVKLLPKVVSSRYDSKVHSPSEIDRLVSQALKEGQSLYQVDEELLMRLKPDLIVTQDLCQVCAPSGNEASRVLKKLPPGTRVLYLTPRTLGDIFDNILELGRATDREDVSREKVEGYMAEIRNMRERLGGRRPRKVFFMEWVDPVFCAGHWLPDLVEAAGGRDPLSSPGRDSGRIEWRRILELDPEVLVAAPCGYHLEDAAASVEKLLFRYPGVEDLQAFKNGQMYVVDADAYFVRPGPRVVQGIRILAEIFHPGTLPGRVPENAYRKLTVPSGTGI